jgi:hypothetical protein
MAKPMRSGCDLVLSLDKMMGEFSSNTTSEQCAKAKCIMQRDTAHHDTKVKVVLSLKSLKWNP